jgi:hypothetical protein
MWHVWGTGEVLAGFLWGNLKGREHLKGNRREDDIKMALQKREWGSQSGLIWLRTETFGQVLSTQ